MTDSGGSDGRPSRLLADATDGRDPSLLFYPSAGHGDGVDLWETFPGVDVFVLADRRPADPAARDDWLDSYAGSRGEVIASTPDCRVARRGDRWLFLYAEDNGVVLDRLRGADAPITRFVGINDGCREGGNHECVNDRTWLRAVFDRFPRGRGRYVTDHSPVVYPAAHRHWHPRAPAPHDELVFDDWRLDRTRGTAGVRDLTAGAHGPILRYDVRPHDRSVWAWESETGVTVTLEHDDIANHPDSLDGVVVSRRCRDRLDHFWESLPTHRVVGGWHRGTADALAFTRSVLRWANDHDLSTVGTVAYGRGEHEGMLTAANDWDGAAPDRLRVFFFDDDDFRDVRPRFRAVE